VYFREWVQLLYAFAAERNIDSSLSSFGAVAGWVFSRTAFPADSVVQIMKIQIRVAYSLICLMQSAGLIVGNGVFVTVNAEPALAASSSSQNESVKLSAFERTVFGETHDNKSMQMRLDQLEGSLFGKAKGGSIADRISAISKALTVSNANLLMPAIAPQMDLSETKAKSESLPPPAPYNDAADVAADRAKSELKQAVALYGKGDMQGAEVSFKRVLTIDSQNADAYYNLGVIAESRSDLQSALSNYRAALNIHPNDQDLKNAVTSVQGKIDQSIAADRQARAQQAVAAQQAAAAQTKQNLKQYTNDAATAFKAGNYDKAIADLSTVAQQAPNDGDVQYALAQAYRGKGDLNSARSYLNRAVTLNPNNQIYRTALASLEQEVAQGGSQGGVPAAAPDFRIGMPQSPAAYGAAGSLSGSPGQSVGFNQNDSANNAPTGQIVPFSDSISSNGSGLQQGFAYSNRGLGGGSGWSSMGGAGYPSSGSSRIKRAAISGLTGAALGAAMSGMFSPGYGSRGRSMMGGAMLGGALGVMTGGLFSRY